MIEAVDGLDEHLSRSRRTQIEHFDPAAAEEIAEHGGRKTVGVAGGRTDNRHPALATSRRKRMAGPPDQPCRNCCGSMLFGDRDPAGSPTGADFSQGGAEQIQVQLLGIIHVRQGLFDHHPGRRFISGHQRCAERSVPFGERGQRRRRRDLTEGFEVGGINPPDIVDLLRREVPQADVPIRRHVVHAESIGSLGQRDGRHRRRRYGTSPRRRGTERHRTRAVAGRERSPDAKRRYPSAVRVVTWNLWWRFGPWEARQPAILAELAEIDADVMLLQEVWADPELGDQAEVLGAALGVAVARTRADDGRPHPFGNAILSRWPILDSHTIVLPGSTGTRSHRSVLIATIDAPHGRHIVATTHLDWRYDGTLTRQRQLMRVCRAIADHRRPGDVNPPLLGGDLNAVPDSDEIRRLTGRGSPYVPGLVFTDAWAAVTDDPGYTWHRDNPHSVDAQWPRRRLDYLLTAWPRPKPTGNPLRAWRAGTTPRPIVPSDHDAVVAEFDVRPSFDRGGPETT